MIRVFPSPSLAPSFPGGGGVSRLSRERMAELQQQVEDLQKALQSQAAQPDDVSTSGGPRGRAPTWTKITGDGFRIKCQIDFLSLSARK